MDVIQANTLQVVKTTSIADTQFIEFDDNRIAYRMIGAGAPIILCNRFRGTLDTWDPLFIDSLAENFKVIIFDYPGIGYSGGKLPTDIMELAKIINKMAGVMGIGQTIVLGWSYGGLVAQAIALNYPDFVSHTVLIGTNPPGNNSIPLEPIFLERALIPMNSQDDEVVLFFEPESEPSIRAAELSHNRIGLRIDMSKIPSIQQVFDLYFAGGAGFREDKLTLRDKLKISKTPFLIISGDHDISFAVENWFPFLRQIPNAHFIIYNKAGHGPQHELPELTAKYINDFIQHKR